MISQAILPPYFQIFPQQLVLHTQDRHKLKCCQKLNRPLPADSPCKHMNTLHQDSFEKEHLWYSYLPNFNSNIFNWLENVQIRIVFKLCNLRKKTLSNFAKPSLAMHSPITVKYLGYQSKESSIFPYNWDSWFSVS